MPIALSSLGEGAPSGANLEYEQVFTDLLLAAQFGEERQAGKEIIPAQEPDAAAIAGKAEAVLAGSHDLRAAVLLAYAGLRLRGFPGLAEATAYIRGCLEDYWDTCHPQLDADDDNDPTMRVNAVLGLADPATVLRAVRLAPLTESASFGRFSLRDLAIAEGEMEAPPDMASPPDRAAIAAALQDTPKPALEAIFAGIHGAHRDVLAINRVFDEKLPGRGPVLDPLIRILKRGVDRLAPLVGAPEAAGEDAVAETAIPAAEAAPAPRSVPGEIASRQDVEAAIDRILAYYGRHEPSSPVPLLLTRARRLVGADFMTIVNDLAPGGRRQRQAAGRAGVRAASGGHRPGHTSGGETGWRVHRSS